MASRTAEELRLAQNHEAAKWRSIADQLAATLLKNGVGGADFNLALDRYREAGGNLEADR